MSLETVSDTPAALSQGLIATAGCRVFRFEGSAPVIADRDRFEDTTILANQESGWHEEMGSRQMLAVAKRELAHEQESRTQQVEAGSMRLNFGGKYWL